MHEGTLIEVGKMMMSTIEAEKGFKPVWVWKLVPTEIIFACSSLTESKEGTIISLYTTIVDCSSTPPKSLCKRCTEQLEGALHAVSASVSR